MKDAARCRACTSQLRRYENLNLMNRVSLLSLLIIMSYKAIAVDVVLSDEGIRGLNLGDDNLVTAQEIISSFPGYTTKYRIGDWEGPSFHLLSVSNPEGKEVFSIVSYIETKSDLYKTKYPIHKISISKGVSDVYGIQIGDDIRKVVEIRGLDLDLIANHHDNSIGKNKIFYKFNYPLTQEEIDRQRGVNYGFAPSLSDALKRNPKINFIYWSNWP